MKTTAWLVVLASALSHDSVALSAETPNIIVIFIDDMGYADIGPFGAKAVLAPQSLPRTTASKIEGPDFLKNSIGWINVEERI